MNYQELVKQIKKKKTFLCVGLDTDLNKIPQHLLSKEDPVFEFNKKIIDATKNYCVAYKPNIAFYESLGEKGWRSLKKTIDYIPKDILTIADAKRGDIGNTARMYAQTFFRTYNFDAVTVAPYMGKDSVIPFLEFKDKWTILLLATSNKGGEDFQYQKLANGKLLFEQVLETSQKWQEANNLMYVVGATRPEIIEKIRALAPQSFFLVPGIGAQGGSLQAACEKGLNDNVGLLVNSSRGIIYAGGNSTTFEKKVEQQAKKIQQEMQRILVDRNIINE